MAAEVPVFDLIKKEIIESGSDTRYRLEAYGFVLMGMEFFFAKMGERRHVTGQELSGGLADYASRQYGLFARHVLDRWGILATDDFGYIVYNLISIGIMSKQPSDKVEDFFHVFDLGEYLDKKDCFTIDPEYIRSVHGI
jgi:uncharacterized repeat protein (TIGR04138 family)